MKVIEITRPFVGEKELPNNGGFFNEQLQALMTKAGHKKGEAWCCYFAEAMFCAAYPEKEELLRLFFSASCVQTFRNFRDGIKKKDKTTGEINTTTWPHEISKIPVVGALVLWQRFKDGSPTGLGHAGIVTEKVTDMIFKTIEGNTNAAGSREGNSVQGKSRSTAWVQTGLNVMGFIIIEL